ncbi:tol-pal system-associated acyl-CoA thioesterase [Beggiatoa leptomitoformis]|uniref:Tol-pal system-associated acyl-CoA thioesterase n=1 Tax=Beggiatoa leptomitoformis TaxID=288004 RepID=A0A2N9YIM4_9GAMM|nr:tol-pal system-associated acyl-CoA thioesterase [Beggiatoa leptomitoformis]ALG67398.1 tol-pal system-associated acyl-CoA thioesterase [Beggiatoa leptomitoformis]AUI70391.1 tol-pal system-associated acyl-CoA thioesterase [Beggiatoa leptomitoformis]
MSSDFHFSLRVYYEDTDLAGIVYYANYLKFMERARTEWLRTAGFEQSELKTQQQMVFAVRQLTIDYLKPAVFDDWLTVSVQLAKCGKASLVLTQTIMRNNELLCTATVKLACVHSITLRPCPFPIPLLEELQKHG